MTKITINDGKWKRTLKLSGIPEEYDANVVIDIIKTLASDFIDNIFDDDDKEYCENTLQVASQILHALEAHKRCKE